MGENMLSRLAPSQRPMGDQNLLARYGYVAPEPVMPARDVMTMPTPQRGNEVRDYGHNLLAQMAGDAPGSSAANIIMGFTGPATFDLAPGLALYHGSRAAGLSNLRPSARGPLGEGVYMSPSMRVAEQYAGDSGHIYQGAPPPQTFYGLGRSYLPSDVNPYQVWRDQVGRLAAAAPEQMRPDVARLAESLGPADGYPLFHRLSQLLGGQGEAQALFRRAGFNGTSGIVDGPEVAIFGAAPVRQVPR